MNENIKKINSKIDINWEIWELFSNEFFLDYFIDYLNKYVEELDRIILNDDWVKTQAIEMKDFILNNFKYLLDQDFSKDKNIDVNLLFEKVIWFFNDRNNLVEFLTYTKTSSLLKKDKYKREYKKMIKIWDYLYSNYWLFEWLNKEEMWDVFQHKLKNKVSDIVLRKTEDIRFKLTENWYPLFVNWYHIIDADFENKYIIDSEEYLLVEFYDKNNILQKCYIDNKWEVLRLEKNVIVKNIEYVFSFGWKNFIKYTDLNNNRVLYIVWVESTLYIKKIFTDATIRNIAYNNRELNYLSAWFDSINEKSVVENYNKLYNEKFEEIDLILFLNFINDWKIENFSDNMEKLEVFSLVEINDIKIIDWISLSNLTVTLEEWIKFDIILTNEWNIISVDWEYISITYDLVEFLWNKFLPYSFDNNYIYGFLDKNLNPIKIPFDLLVWDERSTEDENIWDSLLKLINNNPNLSLDYWKIISKTTGRKTLDEPESKNKYIFSITKTHSKIINGEEIAYYRINNRNDLIIREDKLKLYLNGFESFSDVVESYEISLPEWLELDLWLKDNYYWKIYLKVNSKKELFFYIENNKKIDTKKFMWELKKSNKWKKLLQDILVKFS